MAEEHHETAEGKQPSAMDDLFQAEVALGCVVTIIVVFVVVAICVYVYFWGLKVMP